MVEGLETELSAKLVDGELIAIVEIPEKFDYENQKILGLNTPYVNFVINKNG